MNKRQFLAAAALAGAAPVFGQPPSSAGKGPALLTVTGAIGRPNRGPFDPALDQMMHKQKISFERAFTFDYATLASLPAFTIKPTVEYDGKLHVLRGPLLLDVLAFAGARPADSGKLILRAVDGFAVTLSVEKARRQRFMVATSSMGKRCRLADSARYGRWWTPTGSPGWRRARWPAASPTARGPCITSRYRIGSDPGVSVGGLTQVCSFDPGVQLQA